MVKVNVTFSVEDSMYLNFKTQCIKKNTKYGEQIEKFMRGFSQNQSINDYLSYEEQQNPRIDLILEDMNDIIARLDPKRSQELLLKVQEWQVRLLKK